MDHVTKYMGNLFTQDELLSLHLKKTETLSIFASYYLFLNNEKIGTVSSSPGCIFKFIPSKDSTRFKEITIIDENFDYGSWHG